VGDPRPSCSLQDESRAGSNIRPAAADKALRVIPSHRHVKRDNLGRKLKIKGIKGQRATSEGHRIRWTGCSSSFVYLSYTTLKPQYHYCVLTLVDRFFFIFSTGANPTRLHVCLAP
jgi:hypothetical protein